MDNRIVVGIVGVSGYAGMEVARIVDRHPGFRLGAAISDKWAGRALGDALPVSAASAGVRCGAQADAVASFAGLGLVFLCTPPEASIALAGPALAAGARVVDLSGGFRLRAEQYPRW